MGNCLFPMNHQQLQPLDVHLLSTDTSSNKYSAMNDHHQQQPSTVLRIKVKMSTTEFKELMTKCDCGEGDVEIGRLIIQECLKGNGEALVVDQRGGHNDDEKRVMMISPLQTIHEE